MALQKGISKKMKFYFQEKKNEKNAHNPKELWKAFTFLGMKLDKINKKLLWKMMVLLNLNLRKMQIF